MCSNTDVDIDPYNHMKRLSSLGLCIILSLMLVFGSVFSNPLTFANASSDGDADDESESQGNGNGNDDNGDSSDSADSDSDDNIDADEDQVQDDYEEICDNGIDDNNDGLIDKDDLEACPDENDDDSDESDEQDGDVPGLGGTGGELFSPLGSGDNKEVGGGGKTLFEGENEQPLSEEQAPGDSPTSSSPTNPYEIWRKVCIESGGCPTDPPCYEPPSPGSGLLDDFKTHCPDAQQPQNTGKPAPNEICGNGIDDDGDGLTDGQDPITCPDDDIEICDNGIDDNNDGLTDEEDLAHCPEEQADGENQKPVAVASGPWRVKEGEEVSLSGSFSMDPDGNEITYEWIQTAGPAVKLTDNTSPSPTFVAVASKPGECKDDLPTTLLTFELKVNDGQYLSDAAIVEVKVTNDFDLQTTANANPAGPIRVGQDVTLQASHTGGAGCGGKVGYTWTQTGGSSASISALDSSNPTFSAPKVNSPQQLTFSVIAKETPSGVTSQPATVSITVNPNQIPIALAEIDKNIARVGETVYLGGDKSSDPDGDELKLEWKLKTPNIKTTWGGATVSHGGKPGFKVPDIKNPTTLTFELVAEDPFDKSKPDTVNLKICPDKVVSSLSSHPINKPELDSSVTNGCDYSQIDLRVRPIKILENIPTAWHSFIIYTDEEGKEFYYSGFARDTPSDSFIGYGNGPYKAGTPDYPTPGKVPDALSVTVLKGKDKTQDKADCFVKELKRIEKLNIRYHLTGPNSNTVAKTLLLNCGVPIKFPAGVSAITGWKEWPL